MSVRKFIGDGLRSVIGKQLYVRLRMGAQAEHSYLRKVRGVIHVGPIPDVFQVLRDNISELQTRRALNYLVTDEDGKEYEFHIANNGGSSSSILDLSRHKEMWPRITYTSTVALRGITLTRIFEVEHLDIGQFDALVLDTQGSEYKILMGATKLLANFKFIKVEVPDFDSYKGCCQIGQLSEFMVSQGFREHIRLPFMHVPEVGTYFDVIYKRAHH